MASRPFASRQERTFHSRKVSARRESRAPILSGRIRAWTDRIWPAVREEDTAIRLYVADAGSLMATILQGPQLLRLDSGRLDDRPPLLDLGLLNGGERFGRLLLARGDF